MKKKLLLLTFVLAISSSMLVFGACKNGKNSESGSSSESSGHEQGDVESNFAFTEKSLILNLGKNADLAVTGLAENESVIYYSSNNTAVATVSESGNVVAVASGKATVKAVTNLGNQALIVVNVISAEAFSPVISFGVNSLELHVGDTYGLNGNVTFMGEEIEAEITYASSNESICTVNNGNVVAVANGETYIIARCEYEGKVAETKLKVVVNTKNLAIATSYENIDVNYQDGILLSVDSTFGGEKVQLENLTFALKGNPENVSIVNGNFLKTDGLSDGGKVTVVATFTYASESYTIEREVNVVGRSGIVYKNTGSADQKVYYEKGETVSAPIEPTMSGYKFMGWYLPDGTKYVFGNAFEENLTLTAHWFINQEKDIIYTASDLLANNKTTGFNNNGVKAYEGWDKYFKDPQGVGYVNWVEYYQKGTGVVCKISIPVLDNNTVSNNWNFGVRREGKNGDTWQSFKINGVEVSSIITQDTPLFAVQNETLTLRGSDKISIDISGKNTIDFEFTLGSTVKIWVSEYHGKSVAFDYMGRANGILNTISSVNSFTPQKAYELKELIAEFDEIKNMCFTDYEKTTIDIDGSIRNMVDNSYIVRYSYSVNDEEISSYDYYFASEQLDLPYMESEFIDLYGTHTFIGWFDNGEKYGSGEKVFGNLNLVAKYEITDYTNYTYTYEVDGVVYETKDYHYNDDVLTVSDPTKDGYVFVGWENSQGRLVYFDKPVTATQTFTATWKPVSEYFEEYPATYIDLHTELQLNYLYDDYSSIANYVNGSAELSRPLSVTFTWNEDKFAKGVDTFYYIFRLGKEESLTSYFDFKVFENYVELQNFEVSTEYFYKVMAIYNDGTTAESGVQSFTVKGNIRNIEIEGVSNVRDLGGKTLENGKAIKQGMLFRGGRLNTDGTATPTAEITENGIRVIKNQLGVKTEIDFRESETEVGGLNGVSIIDGVNYYNIPLDTNNLFYGKSELIKELFDIFADENNYPIYFHCSIGTDRTGFVSFLLNGLLGASESDLYYDYLFSVYGRIGNTRQVSVITKYIDNLKTYNGNTLSEKIASYLMEKGVTAEQIATIKTLMTGESAKDFGVHTAIDKVYAVENVVNGIKSVMNLTASDENRARVNAVRLQYNLLTETERAKVYNINDLAEKEIEIANRYVVTFTNFDGADIVINDVIEGRTVDMPTAPTKDGYVFVGWFSNNVQFDFATPVTDNLTLSAKWYVVDESNKQKVVVKNGQTIANEFVVNNDGVKSGTVITQSAAGLTWFHDSDFNTAYDKVSENFVTYNILTGVTTILVPGVNTAMYGKVEFGIRLTAANSHLNSMKINGVAYEKPANGYTTDNYEFVIQGNQIKVYAVNTYSKVLFSTDYVSGSEISIEVSLAENKLLYVSEMHGMQIAFDPVELFEDVENKLVAFADNCGATLTDAQKTEAFGILNAYYNAYVNLNETEKAAHPVIAKANTLRTVLATATGDYFKGIDIDDYTLGENTVYDGTAKDSGYGMANGPYGAEYAPEYVHGEKINNANQSRYMTIVLPKINFVALDCNVSINLGQWAYVSEGKVIVNGHELGSLMQIAYQGVISITKNAEGKFVLTHCVSGTNPTYVLSDEEANGEVAITIVLDKGAEGASWSAIVSDLYVKFN